MNKNILPFLILILFPLIHFAQGRPGIGGQRTPAIGKIYGKIVESGKKSPVEFCTITLLGAQKDTVLSGGLTRSNGDFMLDKLPLGRYRLRIQFIGYKTLYKPVMVTPNLLEQDLGNLAIEPDTRALKEVTIEAEKSSVVMTIDRRIYNVEKDISSRGGTGLDVMRNVPGITVDADGNVNMRNSSPTIFVDGRPTLLTLEQIPADQIDRVEVITNPSAKFDASTSGGIINVVLKKNNKPGYNGMVTVGAGFPSRQNAMVNLNIKEGRFNVGMMYNINRSVNVAKGYTNRTSLRNKIETGSFKQSNENDATSMMHNGRLAIDYNISNRAAITASQAMMFGSYEIIDKQHFDALDSLKELVSYGDRTNSQNNAWSNYTSQVQFRKTFPRIGRELTSDFTYSRSQRNNLSNFSTLNYDKNNLLLPPGEEYQKNNGTGNSNNYTFQLDYVNPITDSAKWEFGVRSNIRIDRSKLEVFYRDPLNNANFTSDTALTNDYSITDYVNAAYATYSSMLWGIGYQMGLRFEQIRFKGELLNKNQSFEYYYPDSLGNLYQSFFPSLFLNKKIGGQTILVDGKNRTKALHEFQLNFTRKINRPGFMQAMPFIMFADKLNYRIGNPNLAPEFINTVEFNYNTILPAFNFFTSVYIKATENPITNFAFPLASDTNGNVLVNTFINGKTQYNYGMENNVRFSLFQRKMDVSINGNFFYTIINASSNNTTIQNQGFSWNTKAMASYKLPKNFTVQLNGNYEAPRIIPQGTTLDQYSIDFSLNKEIMKFITINLMVNDVFNTRRFGTSFESDFLIQDISRRREIRFVRLSVSMRFGEMDVSLFKRKRSNRGDNQGGGMDMEY
jgi:hypothetical protein